MNLKDNLEEVRQEYLRRMTQGHGDLLQDVEHHITRLNGKMLRPRLLLAAAATRGEECLNSRRTHLLAVCVEMIHNSSLLHDDVVDHDISRRGQPSVNAQWDNRVAVLTGDFLLAKTMELLNEVDDSDASRRISLTVSEMVEAELLQLHNPIDSSTYLRIIDGKTARLFATACALGNPAYEDFGLHYGRLFQLRDDIADNEAPSFANGLIRQEEEILKKLPQLSIPEIPVNPQNTIKQ